jgi:all-trans-retinol dehydrogenase (NAD+)
VSNFTEAFVMRVAGSRVLVTGAGHGLGFAIASAFARAGAHVVVTDLDAARVNDAVAKLPGACGYVLNVTDPAQIADVRARLAAEHGPLDVVVNNAGVVFGGPFLSVPIEKHSATVNVNFSGVLAVAHAFLPDLLARPAGQLVNIASASAVIALPNATTYAATKWAVLGFTESLQEELRLLGHRNVVITAICPTYISTGLFTGAEPGKLIGWLTAEQVAAAVVRAVETRREFVMLPWRMRMLYSLCAGLPRTWYKALCRSLGASRSMMGWQGHAPKGPASQNSSNNS